MLKQYLEPEHERLGTELRGISACLAGIRLSSSVPKYQNLSMKYNDQHTGRKMSLVVFISNLQTILL